MFKRILKWLTAVVAGAVFGVFLLLWSLFGWEGAFLVVLVLLGIADPK